MFDVVLREDFGVLNDGGELEEQGFYWHNYIIN